jgi:hypothetical protein
MMDKQGHVNLPVCYQTTHTEIIKRVFLYMHSQDLKVRLSGRQRRQKILGWRISFDFGFREEAFGFMENVSTPIVAWTNWWTASKEAKVNAVSNTQRINFAFKFGVLPLPYWTVRGSNPGGGDIFRTRPDRSWGPPILLNNGYRVFPRSKTTGAWRWPPTPI